MSYYQMWTWLLAALLWFCYSIECTLERTGYSYMFVGEVLLLNCTLHDASSWIADDLVFTLDTECNEDIFTDLNKETNRLDSHTVQLNHKIESKCDAGEYICCIDTPQNPCEIVNSTVVKVQYHPQRVQNISCFVYNWDEHLTCTWDYAVKYIDSFEIGKNHSSDMSVNVTLTAVDNSPLMTVVELLPCPYDLFVYETPICVWGGNLFRVLSKYLLQVTVGNKIRGQEVTQNFSIITKDIVKPSPVSDIMVKEKNSTCVQLEWAHPKIYRLKLFRVTSTTQQHPQNVSNTSALFCGLIPYTMYTFSVECHALSSKGDLRGFWSDVSSVNITTSEAVPESSFEVHGGNYILHPCDGDNKRNVTILLKAVPKNQRNGKIIGYQLEYNGTTIVVNRSSPAYAMVQDVSCQVNLSVKIFSRTAVGPSSNYSRLLILPEIKEPVSDFAVELSTDSLQARAVWNSTANVDLSSSEKCMLNIGAVTDSVSGNKCFEDNVTVFWCQQSKTVFGGICEGEAMWSSAPFSANEMTIPCQFSCQDLMFGISQHNQAITWTHCLFSSHAVLKAPEGLDVLSRQNELTVQWKNQQCSKDYPVHVTGYRIYICEKQNCNSTLRVVDVKGEKNFKHIRDVAAAEYTVTVQTVAFAGHLGPKSQPVQASVPSVTGTEHLSWMFFLIPLLFAGFLIIVFCRAWKQKQKKFRRRLDTTLSTEPRTIQQRQSIDFSQQDTCLTYLPSLVGISVHQNSDREEELTDIDNLLTAADIIRQTEEMISTDKAVPNGYLPHSSAKAICHEFGSSVI